MPTVDAACALQQFSDLDACLATIAGCDLSATHTLGVEAFVELTGVVVAACEMECGVEMEVEADLAASVMETGCDLVSGARLRARALLEGVVLPATDELGWTAADADPSPLWDLTVTIGTTRVKNAFISSLTIELDDHAGYESCSISFASTRSRKWPSRAQIVVAYDGWNLFEGRLRTQRRSIGTELGWSLEFVGNLNQLRDHRAFRKVYADSDLDSWRADQGPQTESDVYEVSAS